ncbi:cyclic GMP-AMP synthase [Polymixia lowei]
MSRATPQRKVQKQNSTVTAPPTPVVPRPTPPNPSAPSQRRRPLAKACSSPADLQPSLGKEAEEAGCEDGEMSLIDIECSQTASLQDQEEINGHLRSPAPSTLRPRRRLQQKAVEEPGVADEPVPISLSLARWIRASAQNLKIRPGDRQWASEQVNDFRDNLLKFLKNSSDQPYFNSVEFFNSGSYFEMVKIHKPNEFDMMLKLQTPSRLNMKSLDGGLFYQLDLIRPTRSPIRAFVLENERTLSSRRILSEMHRLVRKFNRTYQAKDERCFWEVNRKRLTSPAVTLSLYGVDGDREELISVDVVPALEVPPSQGWPLAARNGPDVDKWLGKKTRQDIKSSKSFFVPKRIKGRNLSEAAKDSWRISFSHIEKQIIRYHGNKKTCCESRATKCCRKQSFRLLKSLIEGLKVRFPQELDTLCSYHGKTAFLHTLSIRYEDSLWACHQLPSCFMHLLGALEGHAQSGLLPHFFVPDCNLFSSPGFPRKALVFLSKALAEQKREGLPLLKPPAPVPPMVELINPIVPVANSTENKPPSSVNQLPDVDRVDFHNVDRVDFHNTGLRVKIILPFVIVLIFVLFMCKTVKGYNC